MPGVLADLLVIVQATEPDKLKPLFKEVVRFLGLSVEEDSDALDLLKSRAEVAFTSKPVEVAGGLVRGEFGCMVLEREFVLEGARIFVGRRVAGFEVDTVFVVETKIDDVSGEVIANAVDRIMERAIDVEVVSVLGKKGRPSLLLRALSKPEKVEEVASSVMRETGSTGVRVYSVLRLKSPREVVRVKVKVKGNDKREHDVRVKVSGVNVKPEFEDVKKLAEKEGISLLEAYRIVYLHLREIAARRRKFESR